MSDSTANLPQISASQASKEVTANANFSAASPSMIFGKNDVTSTGLTWGYLGGRWGGTSVSNGTLSLTGSTTNYVVGNRSTGAVSVSTATTNWNSTTTYGRLYSIVTGSSTVTSYQDHRAGPSGIFVGSASGVGSGTVTNTGGNLTANAVVLGAGSADAKVVAGVTTDGTSALNLGVSGTSVGKVVLANATSGTITLQPTTGALGTVTLTVPAATDTLVGRATTDTLTNKTLVAPALGTPASGTLTNCTGLPVAGGGTGVASLTAYAPVFGGTTSTGAVQSGTVGTAGQVLTSNGAGALPTFQAAGGGSLANFTEAVNTSAPNGSVPVVSLTATNAATHVDAVLAPKGTGGIAAAVADNSTGGNKRGTNAVDLQLVRSANTNVASGASSGLFAGEGNVASAARATCVGGSTNTASAQDSGCFAGIGNVASGQESVCIGGGGNTSSGQKSVTIGGSNTASGGHSFVHGLAGTDRGLLSSRVHSGTNALGVGKSQRHEMVLTRTASGTTPAVLTVGDSAPSTTNQFVLPDSSTAVVKGMVSVIQNTGANQSTWTFEAAITRGANAAATAMLATCTPVMVGQSAGASTWTLVVNADTTNGCLAVTLTCSGSGTFFYATSVLDAAVVVA